MKSYFSQKSIALFLGFIISLPIMFLFFTNISQAAEAPILKTAIRNSAQTVTLTYSAPVTVTGTASQLFKVYDLTVNNFAPAYIYATSATASGSTVTINFSGLSTTSIYSLEYTPILPEACAPTISCSKLGITASDGFILSGFSNQTITNNLSVSSTPTLVSAIRNSAQTVTLTYSAAVKLTGTGAQLFKVYSNTSGNQVENIATSATASGSTVTINFSGLSTTSVYRLNYARITPTSCTTSGCLLGITNSSGDVVLPSFSEQAITNNLTTATAPTIVSAIRNSAQTVTLTYSAPVTVTGYAPDMFKLYDASATGLPYPYQATSATASGSTVTINFSGLSNTASYKLNYSTEMPGTSCFTNPCIYKGIVGTSSGLSVLTFNTRSVTNNFTAPVTPTITSVSPTSGFIGSNITVIGTGFLSTGNKIKFGNLGTENSPAYNNISSSNGTTLIFAVPSSNYLTCWSLATPCTTPATLTEPGAYSVSVINTNGTSGTKTYTVIKNDVTTTPTIVSAIRNSAQTVTLTYSAPVTVTGTASQLFKVYDLTVNNFAPAYIYATSATASGSTVTINFSGLSTTSIYSLEYTPILPEACAPTISCSKLGITASDGFILSGFSNQTITNNLSVSSTPTLVSAIRNSAQTVTLTYSDTVSIIGSIADIFSMYDASVSGGIYGTPYVARPSSASTSGNMVTLSFSDRLSELSSSNYILSYTPTTSSGVKAIGASDFLRSFSAQMVYNNFSINNTGGNNNNNNNGNSVNPNIPVKPIRIIGQCSDINFPTVVNKKSKGSTVKNLEKFIKKYYFKSLIPDNYYKASTVSAIKFIQKKNRLKITGYINVETYNYFKSVFCK